MSPENPTLIEQKVQEALAVLGGCGLRILESTKTHAIQSARNASRAIQHQTDPLTSVILWLTRQDRLEFLNQNAWFLPVVESGLSSIAAQMRWATGETRIEARMEQISLSARGLLLIRSSDAEEVPLQEHIALFREECCLPDPDSPFGTIRKTEVTPSYLNDRVIQLHRFSIGVPLAGGSAGSVSLTDELAEIAGDANAQISYRQVNEKLEIVRSGRNRAKTRFRFATDTATTQALARTASLEPFCYQVLKGFVNGSIEPGDIGSFLKFSLGLFHGIPHLDIPDLGLKAPTALGRLTKTHLELEIGSGYYPLGAACYVRSRLSLPLPAEIAYVLKQLPDTFFEHETLEQALPPQHSRDYRIWLKKAAKQTGLENCVWGKAVHLVFTRLCVHDLQLCASEAGLLKGNPPPLSRGPSAYICASGAELRADIHAVAAKIREKAGIAPVLVEHEQSAQSDNDMLHGTPCLPLENLVAHLRYQVESAQTSNDLFACVEGVMRILGRRNVGDPVNPLVYYSSYPRPCLAIADKIIEGTSRTRIIPISPALAYLIETCGMLLGRNQILPFVHGNEIMPLSELPDALRYRRIFSAANMRQPGRTSLYNALRKEKAGELVLDSFMGHGATMFQPMGHMNPLSLERLHEVLSNFLLPLYSKYGIDDLANLLARRLVELVPPGLAESKICLRATDDAPIRRVGDESEKEPSNLRLESPILAEELRPWTFPDDAAPLQTDGRVAVPGSLPKCIGHFPLSPIGLVIALAQIGVPPDNLIRFAPYYSTENFVLNRKTGQIFFLALGDHAKLGGLSVYPLPVCNQSEQANDPVICMLRHLFNRVVTRRRLFPRNFDLAQGGDLTADGQKTLKAKIGSAFRTMIPMRRSRTALTDREAYKLLRRAAHQECRAKYPAPVLFALVVGKKAGLNNMAVEDVVRLREGQTPELVFLLDQARSYSSFLSLRSDTIPAPKLEAISSEVSPTERTRLLFDAIKKHGVIPSARTLRPLLSRCGFRDKELELALRSLMVLARKKGLLRVAKAERLFSSVEQEEMVKVIAQDHDADSATEAVLQICSGCRTGEFRNKRSSEAQDEVRHKVILEEGLSAQFVAHGKSKKARRWVILTDVGTKLLVDTLFTLLTKLRRDSQRGVRTFLTAESPKMASRFMSRFLRKHGFDLSSHQLRRFYFLRNYEALMKNPTQGAFFSRLCLVAQMGGHGSVGIMIREYVGTGILAFGFSRSANTSPIGISTEQSARLFRLASRLAYRDEVNAEKNLKLVLSGDAAYVSTVRSYVRWAMSTVTSGIGESPRVKLQAPDSKIVVRNGNEWLCEIPLPRGDTRKGGAPGLRLRTWEAAAVKIIERCLRLGRSVVLKDCSGRQAFRNKLSLLAKHHGAALST